MSQDVMQTEAGRRMDAQQGEREEAAAFMDRQAERWSGPNAPSHTRGRPALYRLAAAALRSVHQGEPVAWRERVREAVAGVLRRCPTLVDADAFGNMVDAVASAACDAGGTTWGRDGVDLTAFCLYYDSKRLTMLDAAEDWVSFTSGEREPFVATARQLASALDAFAPPAAPHGEPDTRVDRWRAVEGGRVQPPDLVAFRSAAEEDRCAYCGIVDPEVDEVGHCSNCGGWLPPSDALIASAPHGERERALGAECERLRAIADENDGYAKMHAAEVNELRAELAAVLDRDTVARERERYFRWYNEAEDKAQQERFRLAERIRELEDEVRRVHAENGLLDTALFEASVTAARERNA